jgi:hypothetical protein
METLISLSPNELFRLPAGSRWECVGGSGWLTQAGEDIAVQCGNRIEVTDRQGALIEALGGQIRLRLEAGSSKLALPALFTRMHRIA